jgi:hypothetical protein
MLWGAVTREGRRDDPIQDPVGGPIEDPIEGRIDAILEVGRRTRPASPRWLWVAAAIVGVICATGFAVVMLSDGAPADHPVERRDAPAAGLATGLLLGGAGGLVIGFVLGRQRRDHSSRSRP